jgi:hypothetical protein
LGATLIKSAVRAPDEKKRREDNFLMQVITMRKKTRSKYFGVYTQKYSTIASGATPIGSAGHAPDVDEDINFKIPRGELLHMHWNKLSTSLSKYQKFGIAIH